MEVASSYRFFSPPILFYISRNFRIHAARSAASLLPMTKRSGYVFLDSKKSRKVRAIASTPRYLAIRELMGIINFGDSVGFEGNLRICAARDGVRKSDRRESITAERRPLPQSLGRWRRRQRRRQRRRGGEGGSVAVESSQVIKSAQQLAAVFRTVRGPAWAPHASSALRNSCL